MKGTKELNKMRVGAHDCAQKIIEKDCRGRACSAQKGITLIALIITIIVMLILVAVTISMAVNGGLFNYAGKAVSETEISQEKEYITFAVSTIKMKKYANNDNTLIGEDELEEELKKYAEGVTVDGFNNLTITFASGRSYTISQDGDITLGDNTQTTGKWKQFAASDSGQVMTLEERYNQNKIYGLDTEGNVYVSYDGEDTELVETFSQLIADNGRIVDISEFDSMPAYIMENGKAYLFDSSIICINDEIEALKNEKIVKLIGIGAITENGKAFDISGTCLNDEIEVLNDKKIINVGSYKLSETENVIMVILEDEKAYYINEEGGLTCFSDAYEELKGKKIVSSLIDGVAILVTEDGKAYEFKEDVNDCFNDLIEELNDRKIIGVNVYGCFRLENGEMFYVQEGMFMHWAFEILQGRKIMAYDPMLELIWLNDGASFYSMQDNIIINCGNEEVLFWEVLSGKNIVQISVGENNTSAIDSNGKVWTWGDGILGNGTEKNSDTPICISEIEGNPLNGVKMVQISTGTDHTVAIDSNGKIWTWGYNDFGQLGYGPSEGSYWPVCISDMEGNPLEGKNIVKIEAGAVHTVAVDSNGKVWTWGAGKLGNGTEKNSDTPICINEIEGNPLNGVKMVQISTGTAHTVALDNTGKVWAWGYNGTGQLGNGTYEDCNLPVCISDMEGNLLSGTKIIQVSAGTAHTVALDNTGKVWTWGYNGTGQLADETTEHTDTPMCVSDINSTLNGKNIVKIEAGGLYTVLLDNNDTFYIYGD